MGTKPAWNHKKTKIGDCRTIRNTTVLSEISRYFLDKHLHTNRNVDGVLWLMADGDAVGVRPVPEGRVADGDVVRVEDVRRRVGAAPVPRAVRPRPRRPGRGPAPRDAAPAGRDARHLRPQPRLSLRPTGGQRRRAAAAAAQVQPGPRSGLDYCQFPVIPFSSPRDWTRV